jgi:hypothetical protein
MDADEASEGFADWGAKIGPYQNVKIEIVPIHLSVSG